MPSLWIADFRSVEVRLIIRAPLIESLDEIILSARKFGSQSRHPRQLAQQLKIVIGRMQQREVIAALDAELLDQRRAGITCRHARAQANFSG